MAPANINTTVLGGATFLPVTSGSANAALRDIHDVAVQVGVGIDAVDTAPATGLVELNLSHLMLWTMDKQDFIDQLAFEDPLASDNVDLAAITLTPSNSTFTYRSIASLAQDLEAVHLQQANFLKVHRFSKDASGAISGANVIDSQKGDKTVGAAIDMKSALNAQVCQLQDMVNGYTSDTAGTDALKTLTDSDSTETAKQLAIEELRTLGAPMTADKIGPPNGNAGPVVDELGRSFGDVLNPALTMVMSVGDYSTAVLGPAGKSTTDDAPETHTYNLYYNVRLVSNDGTELAGRFQTNIEKKFDQSQQVRIFARWVHQGPLMPNTDDGRSDNSLWPANSQHQNIGPPHLSHGPQSVILAGDMTESSGDILEAVSGPLGRVYGRIEWVATPEVVSVEFSKEKVNDLVAGLIDVAQGGDKIEQIAAIKTAVSEAIVAGSFKGACSQGSGSFTNTLTSSVNMMGYNDGPDRNPTPGGVSYSQEFQSCVAFTDAHASLS